MTINWYALAKEEEKLAKRKMIIPRKDESRKLPEVVKFALDGSKLWVGNVVYNQIPGHEEYYISKGMIVKNHLGRTLRNSPTSNDSQIRINIDGVPTKIYRHILLWKAWSELAPLQSRGGDIMWGRARWRFIEGYEDLYIISDMGVVRNYKSWAIMTPSPGKGPRVSLFKDGKQRAYTVSKLLRQHFPEN